MSKRINKLRAGAAMVDISTFYAWLEWHDDYDQESLKETYEELSISWRASVLLINNAKQIKDDNHE